MTLRPLILPVETQVREFDAKLLLACVAAERGVPTYIGFQNRIRNRITRIPPGVVIVKGFAAPKARMLKIMGQLGHEIYGWDEEGLVHHPNYVYHDRRMGAGSLAHLAGVFAWGRDYRDMFESSPFYDGTPVHLTGNPRIDLLRPDVRAFYDPTVAKLREQYGDYILVNSSFGISNTAVTVNSGKRLGTAKEVAASSKYWKGQIQFRNRLFATFMEMTVQLAGKFPEKTILLRPHPAENFETWDAIASQHPNLHVVPHGNVVPWMMGADLIIHNGCMTAVEGTLLGKTAIAYQPLTSEEFDRHLPNAVSRSCGDLEELYRVVEKTIGASPGLAVPERYPAILDEFIEYDESELASDRIMDVLTRSLAAPAKFTEGRGGRVAGWASANLRGFWKGVRFFKRDDIYSSWHQRQQFPEVSTAEVSEKVDRLKTSLGRFSGVQVRQFLPDLFLVERR